METMKRLVGALASTRILKGGVTAVLLFLLGTPVFAGGEAELKIPALQGSFLGMTGHNLLLIGLVICLLGVGFGLFQYAQIRDLPVHKSMLEISELIYETCKTYLVTQIKFIAVLWTFIALVIVAYFKYLSTPQMSWPQVIVILIFSIIGILGSVAVAWFGIRINTFANSRTAFASLGGKPYPTMEIPLKAGMSIGMLLISVELFLMLAILLFVPGNAAGRCFIGFAIGESLGAAALRIAGGIFTKIADIGSDLMKIVFKIKEDDARNPGVIADCVGDNAGDSVGPTADGFETYGVTGVALITFILLAVNEKSAGLNFQSIQVSLLVWIFVMRGDRVTRAARRQGMRVGMQGSGKTRCPPYHKSTGPSVEGPVGWFLVGYGAGYLISMTGMRMP